MKLRTFLASLAAVAAAPWKLVAKSREPREVFPHQGDNLVGLIVQDPIAASINRYVITSKATDPFTWEGKEYHNPWMNKWYGYRVDDPTKTTVLLCIDDYHLRKHPAEYQMRFYEP